MKTLIAALLVLTSTFAAAANIGTYSFSTWSEVEERELLNINVSITDTKTMEIEIVGDMYPQVIQLKDSVYREIAHSFHSLENAEISIRNNMIVCMMVAPIDAQINHLYIDQRLISGPTGCWVSNKVQPKNDYKKAMAMDLKKTLKILALTLMK